MASARDAFEVCKYDGFESRKVHNEMSWMNSVEMTEMINMKQDYMSFMYDSALRIAQVCGSSILRFINTIHTDLFTTFVTDIIHEMKEVYEGLQQKWLLECLMENK